MSWRLKAIKMVQEGGYSQTEIAQACGVRLDAVRGWVTRASIAYPIYCDPEGRGGCGHPNRYYMLPFRYDVEEYERVRMCEGEALEPTADQRVVRA
jgi:transposase-like protein